MLQRALPLSPYNRISQETSKAEKSKGVVATARVEQGGLEPHLAEKAGVVAQGAADAPQHLGNVPRVLAGKRPRDQVPVHHNLSHVILG